MNKANAAEVKSWFNRYVSTSGAEATLWGFEYEGFVYGFYPTESALLERTRITRASTKKGGAKKLMLNKPTTAQKQALIIGGQAQVICTIEYLENEAKTYGLNKGMAFEQIISLQNEQGYYKKGDKRGYWECGDVVIDGKETQVKFEACSLSEFKTIEKAERLKG